MTPENFALLLLSLTRKRMNDLYKNISLSKAEWDRSQVLNALKTWGWYDGGKGGDHPILMRHPHLPRSVPFQGPQTMYNDQYRNRHLSQAGLMYVGSKGAVEPDPSHPYFSLYKKHGWLPGPLDSNELADTVKTWKPPHPDTKYLKVDDVHLGDHEDPAQINKALRQLKMAPHEAPAIPVMQLADNEYGTLDHHHYLKAAKLAGMTHVPVSITQP